jgi:hypothetical protein
MPEYRSDGRQPTRGAALAARSAFNRAAPFEAKHYCREPAIFIVDAGQIIEENEPEAFFTNPPNVRTQLLLSQIPRHRRWRHNARAGAHEQES